MEIINKDAFDNADKLPSIQKPSMPNGINDLSDSEFSAMLKKLENPVDSQKELAIQVKVFLDAQIKKELADPGYLSDYTRRWISEYNDILDRIQKNTHGSLNVDLHIHSVSHSMIAAKVRKYKDIEIKAIKDGNIPPETNSTTTGPD
jgi:hypothetical protein